MVTVDRATTSFMGLSTDTKPTDGNRNGDTFFEMDTSTLYAWNADGGEWLPIGSNRGE